VGCSASLGILLTLPVVGKHSDVPISHMILMTSTRGSMTLTSIQSRSIHSLS